MYEIWLEIPYIRKKFGPFTWFVKLLEKHWSTVTVTSSTLWRCAESQTDRYAPLGQKVLDLWLSISFVSLLWLVPSCPATHTPGWTEIIPQTEIHPDKRWKANTAQDRPCVYDGWGEGGKIFKGGRKRDLEQDTERVKMRQRALDRWHTMTAGDDNDWLWCTVTRAEWMESEEACSCCKPASSHYLPPSPPPFFPRHLLHTCTDTHTHACMPLWWTQPPGFCQSLLVGLIPPRMTEPIFPTNTQAFI